MESETAFKVVFSKETLLVDSASDPPLRNLLKFAQKNVPSELRRGTKEWEALSPSEKTTSDLRFIATAAAATLGGVATGLGREEADFENVLEKLHIKQGDELPIGRLFKSEGIGFGLERHRAALVKYITEALHVCPCKLLRSHPNRLVVPFGEVPKDCAFPTIFLEGKYFVVDCTANLGRLEEVSGSKHSPDSAESALPTFGDTSPRLPAMAERHVHFASPTTASTGSPTPCTPGGSPSTSPTLQRLAASVERALKGQPFLSQASAQLGRPVAYAGHRRVEPDRRRILEASYPELKTATLAFAVTVQPAAGDESPLRKKGGSAERELLAIVPAGASQDLDNLQPIVVMGTCRSTKAPISPCECIEYIFKEQPNHWRAAQLSLEGVDHLKRVGMEVWVQCLEEARTLSSGSREALIAHLTEDGPPIFNAFDASVFPTPKELLPAYEVKGTSKKALLIPHPVSALRCWNTKEQRYEVVDAQLVGAPAAGREQEWWDERMKLLQEEHALDKKLKSGSKKKKRATGCC